MTTGQIITPVDSWEDFKERRRSRTWRIIVSVVCYGLAGWWIPFSTYRAIMGDFMWWALIAMFALFGVLLFVSTIITALDWTTYSRMKRVLPTREQCEAMGIPFERN